MSHLKPKSKSSYISIIISLVLISLITIRIIEIRKERFIDQKNADAISKALSTNDQIIIGEDTAPNSLILFYSYDCKHCRAFFTNYYSQLYDEFISTQKLNLILKPVNLSESSEMAEAYALLYCLNHFDLFNDLHEILLADHNIIYSPKFTKLKNDLIMENIEIAQNLDQQTQAPSYLTNNKQLLLLKQNSVPTFILKNRIFKGKISAKEIQQTLK